MAGLWEDALGPYLGTAEGEPMPRPLPDWLPPDVQRYMRAGPSMVEGGYAPGPGWSYPGLMDEMSARKQMPGGQGREEALVRQIEQSRQQQNYPRDEGGVRGYAWGGSSTGPSPISDLIQRLLGNRMRL